MIDRQRLIGTLAACLLGSLLSPTFVSADDEPEHDQQAAIRAAIERSIEPLQAGMRGSAEKRQCFTCHSQGAPLMALAEVRRRGIHIDEEAFDSQVQHTLAHLKRGKKNYDSGRGQGGKSLTAGYALWALEEAEYEADDTTKAVAQFLLDYQKDKPQWSHPGRRPPSSGSDFKTTYVSLRGLHAFHGEQQTADVESRTDQIGQWLADAQPVDTEDHVFRLFTLPYVGVDKSDIQEQTRQLLDLQRDDGGWAQTPNMTSDAYATATALAALLEVGELSTEDPQTETAVQWLLDKQLEDGTWRVKTRAKGFQTYYETGFPHGKDQFISMAASSWAVKALAMTLPAAE